MAVIINNDNINKDYYNLGRILNKYECHYLKNEIIEEESVGNFILETDTRYYNNSVAGINKTSWYLLNRFLELASYTSGKTLQIANPYTRVYKNGSILNPHIDREGLDWTISLCIFSNIEKDWPLQVKNKEGEILEFPTIEGYASLVNGRKLEHWRDPLECNERHMVIQTFLHYTEIN